MNKVVAFDLDGTLVDSVHHLMPAYLEALEEMNLPRLPENVLLQCIGGTVTDNHKIIMPDQPAERYNQYELLVAQYAAQYAKTRGQSYPRIAEMLDTLRDMGYVTVLCSNGTRDYVCPLLAVLELDHHLSHIQALSGEKNKTELLATIISRFDSAGNTVLVGDRKFDAEAARNNGVPFIGCRYGLFPDEVAAAMPQAVANAPMELPDAILRLLGPCQ